MSFGDVRVAERADWLIERVATAGTLVLRKLGETRAGEKAVHRFLSSPHVSAERIVETLAARTAVQCAGRRILAVQDTTEINFSGRDKKRRGFGPAGDGKTPGFFIHPVIAVDIESEAVVGLVDAAIWTRSADRVGSRRSRAIEDKESARWLSGCQAAAGVLSDAAEVTMVADRESDIYLLFARKPNRLDLIVRAGQDRSLADGGTLFEALGGAEPLSRSDVRVAPRGPGDKGRVANVELRAGSVRIARSQALGRSEAPDSVELTLVEARDQCSARQSTDALALAHNPQGYLRCAGRRHRPALPLALAHRANLPRTQERRFGPRRQSSHRRRAYVQSHRHWAGWRHSYDPACRRQRRRPSPGNRCH